MGRVLIHDDITIAHSGGFLCLQRGGWLLSRWDPLPCESALLDSEVLLCYNAKIMAETMYGTRRCVPENSSSIDVLFAEVNTEGAVSQATDDIAHEICEVDDSITRLQEVYSDLKSDHEIGVINKIRGNLNEKHTELVQKQKARQLNLRRARDASQNNLEGRIRQRLEREICKIYKGNCKDGRATPKKIAAAGLAAHIYEAMIFGDLLDNQPQERNNHGS